jgi:hypothetical protein
VRPPEEIAADCENVHGGEYRSLLREAAEALREAVEQWELWENSRNTNYTTAGIAIKRAEQAEADRDALLAVARAAHTAWYNDARYSVQVEEAIAALSEHLRQQVEQT